jgi:hypothetical protein
MYDSGEYFNPDITLRVEMHVSPTTWIERCDPLRFPGSAVSAEPESGSGPKAF